MWRSNAANNIIITLPAPDQMISFNHTPLVVASTGSERERERVASGAGRNRTAEYTVEDESSVHRTRISDLQK